MKTVRVLALNRYGSLGASSRIRTLQYLPILGEAGVEVQTQALFDDELLIEKYQLGQYGLIDVIRSFVKRIRVLLQRHQFDLLWVEKEALPWWPLWAEATLLSGVPYVLDYDDAVFHNYDLHSVCLVRWFLGKRIDGLMAKAALVICGNDYLSQRAQQAGAQMVKVLPTVISLDCYPARELYPHKSKLSIPRIIWIGSPSTARYLTLLNQILQKLAERVSFIFRVIGAKFFLPGVQVECVPWSETTEVSAIAECDVGVMPLLDSPWERGKCGYKLIQYMACSLPVVASPVGVNTTIVQHEVNGCLAHTPADWCCALERYLTQPELRKSAGQAGRQIVEQQYCTQVTGPLLVELLRLVAKGG